MLKRTVFNSLETAVRIKFRNQNLYSSLKRAYHSDNLEEIKHCIKKSLSDVDSMSFMIRMKGYSSLRSYSENLFHYLHKAQQLTAIDEIKPLLKKSMEQAFDALESAHYLEEDDY